MSISRATIALSTDGSGAGTATTNRPISGEILEIRCDTTSLCVGGSADYTFTRPEGGGTVLSVSNQVGTWSYQPRANVTTSSGGVVTGGAGGTAEAPFPIDGALRCVIAQGALSAAGTISVFYRS